MTLHLQRQIDRLKEQILTVGTLVEEAVHQAIKAVETRDDRIAQEVIDGDTRIDMMEIDVEEECLHTLALHQPVAFDLRYVIAVLKINNDLERIADQAVTIAEQVQFLAERSPVDVVPYDLSGMTRRVSCMLQQSLDALVAVDAAKAELVRRADDEVDSIHRHMYDQITAAMAEHPDQVPQLIHLMSISRSLERMADLTVNIAEEVIYMARGDILRHRKPVNTRRPESQPIRAE